MNGAHYSQQHIALQRFIKKHYNQSPGHSSLFQRWKKASKQEGTSTWKQAQWPETEHLALASGALK